MNIKKITLLLLIILSSCSLWKKSTPPQPEKPLVIVSAAPYIKIVQQIANNSVTVRSIIPPDVDPHNFEPSPKDITPLIHTSLWIQVGEGFESLLQRRLEETSKEMEILNLTKTTKVLHTSCKHHHHDHHERGCHSDVDTHYWLDPITVIEQAKMITSALSKIAPKNKEKFEKNLEALVLQLNKLNNKITTELAPYKGDAFLTTHSAYGYFCHRYHLLQFSIEPDDGKEARSKDIYRVVEIAKTHHDALIAILIQPQHVNRAAETIGEKFNLKLFMVNPYEENYIGTILKLTEITKEFGKRSSTIKKVNIIK